jgi:hypothetical protein
MLVATQVVTSDIHYNISAIVSDDERQPHGRGSEASFKDLMFPEQETQSAKLSRDHVLALRTRHEYSKCIMNWAADDAEALLHRPLAHFLTSLCNLGCEA